jgi:glycosyltransferase involved in cell wall biosynthesis
MLKNFAISLLDKIFPYLPCYVVNRTPLIIISYWHDFIVNKEAFIKSLSEYKDVYILIQLGWHRETPERAKEIADAVEELNQENEGLHFTFLCNSPNEKEMIESGGLTGIFCHQNAFVNENLYPVVPDAEKIYDAIYVARITPFKRQELAQRIKTLRFIGWTNPNEADYFNMIMDLIPQAVWTCNVSSRKIYKEINAARTGLCLSAEEGAMFVSAEYLLCGIPVVTTRNMGGRDSIFPEGAFYYVEDNPEDVAEGVEKMKNNQMSPLEIREAYLEKMLEHRKIFINLIQDIIDSAGVNSDFSKLWEKVFIHKMGLRYRIPLLKKIEHGIKYK